jgi:hypothetical protein
MKKIAITINTSTLDRTWLNGLYQNIHALTFLLAETGKYEITLLVSKLDRTAEKYSLLNPSIRVVSYGALVAGETTFDLVIEVGYTFSPGDIAKIRNHNKNIKIAKISYGNMYFALQECIVAPQGASATASYAPDAPRDALWTSPHFDFSRDWEALIANAPIARQAPYIWSPKAIELRLKEAGITRDDLCTNRRNVAVLEPNLNIMKTTTIPAAIAEALHRRDNKQLEQVLCFNAHQLLENKTAMSVFGHLDVSRDKVISFEKRLDFITIFQKYAGTLLSHQHYNALNYVYLEAMYLGIPFVHNSPYFREAGYYYEGFDIHTGADRLAEAVSGKELEYAAASEEYIYEHSPQNPKNIQGYIDLVEEVLQ